MTLAEEIHDAVRVSLKCRGPQRDVNVLLRKEVRRSAAFLGLSPPRRPRPHAAPQRSTQTDAGGATVAVHSTAVTAHCGGLGPRLGQLDEVNARLGRIEGLMRPRSPPSSLGALSFSSASTTRPVASGPHVPPAPLGATQGSDQDSVSVSTCIQEDGTGGCPRGRRSRRSPGHLAAADRGSAPGAGAPSAPPCDDVGTAAPTPRTQPASGGLNATPARPEVPEASAAESPAILRAAAVAVRILDQRHSGTDASGPPRGSPAAPATAPGRRVAVIVHSLPPDTAPGAVTPRVVIHAHSGRSPLGDGADGPSGNPRGSTPRHTPHRSSTPPAPEPVNTALSPLVVRRPPHAVAPVSTPHPMAEAAGPQHRLLASTGEAPPATNKPGPEDEMEGGPEGRGRAGAGAGYPGVDGMDGEPPGTRSSPDRGGPAGAVGVTSGTTSPGGADGGVVAPRSASRESIDADSAPATGRRRTLDAAGHLLHQVLDELMGPSPPPPPPPPPPPIARTQAAGPAPALDAVPSEAPAPRQGPPPKQAAPPADETPPPAHLQPGKGDVDASAAAAPRPALGVAPQPPPESPAPTRQALPTAHSGPPQDPEPRGPGFPTAPPHHGGPTHRPAEPEPPSTASASPIGSSSVYTTEVESLGPGTASRSPSAPSSDGPSAGHQDPAAGSGPPSRPRPSSYGSPWRNRAAERPSPSHPTPSRPRHQATQATSCSPGRRSVGSGAGPVRRDTAVGAARSGTSDATVQTPPPPRPFSVSPSARPRPHTTRPHGPARGSRAAPTYPGVHRDEYLRRGPDTYHDLAVRRGAIDPCELDRPTCSSLAKTHVIYQLAHREAYRGDHAHCRMCRHIGQRCVRCAAFYQPAPSRSPSAAPRRALEA